MAEDLRHRRLQRRRRQAGSRSVLGSTASSCRTTATITSAGSSMLQAYPPAYVKGFEKPIAVDTVLSEGFDDAALAPDSASAVSAARRARRRLCCPRGSLAPDERTAARAGSSPSSASPGSANTGCCLSSNVTCAARARPCYCVGLQPPLAVRPGPYGLLRDLFGQQFSIQDSGCDPGCRAQAPDRLSARRRRTNRMPPASSAACWGLPAATAVPPGR